MEEDNDEKEELKINKQNDYKNKNIKNNSSKKDKFKNNKKSNNSNSKTKIKIKPSIDSIQYSDIYKYFKNE